MPNTDSIDAAADAARFIRQMNKHDAVATWAEAAALGVPTVDLAREEFAARQGLADLTATAAAASTNPELLEATRADIATHQARLDQVAERRGRYFLASGATIQRDSPDTDAYQSGWWYDQRATRIETPNGERIHHPGVHPDASIHPTATTDPNARIERGATIGPRTHIAAYAHIGRDTIVGADAVIGPGACIGTGNQLGPHTWVSDGATIEPASTIGHYSTVGAGSRVTYGTEIEPYSRLGTATTTSSTPRNHNQQSNHVAGLVENLMRLDRE